MKVSTYEKFRQRDQFYRDTLAKNQGEEYAKEYYAKKDQDCLDILQKFPYSVVVEGEYPSHDFSYRWCWQNFGPREGKCYDYQSEYPGCPLVLAPEYIQTGSWKDKNGNDHEWKQKAYKIPATMTMRECEEVCLVQTNSVRCRI